MSERTIQNDLSVLRAAGARLVRLGQECEVAEGLAAAADVEGGRMHRICQLLLGDGSPCGRSAAWQDPVGRLWLCELHALRDRPRCAACDRAAAWRRPESGEWLCLEHAPIPERG